MTRQKELFKPKEPGKVGMYVCGITAYDLSHIGHARVYVAFDVLFRYLRHLEYEVYYVRNVTDVDDKFERFFSSQQSVPPPLAIAPGLYAEDVQVSLTLAPHTRNNDQPSVEHPYNTCSKGSFLPALPNLPMQSVLGAGPSSYSTTISTAHR
ncbi:Cysteine--trna ligase [Thalictrum thalictroides]|uniref:Cysteine--trna ligase n=1 Tax=Thalictrum thalictroides TaxID=46969 RepID=A0A7J6X209_THATH|nr:Cysteine--trna ligase [Thalictrum thalictroides]